MTTKMTLRIVGDHLMNCGGCEGNIRFALSQISGVAAVKPDRSTQLVELELSSPDVTLEVLQANLELIGYQAELA